MEIRLLSDHRNDLVAQRTRTVNRLRWHLLELCPELERSVGRGAFNQARVLDRVDRALRKLSAGARVRVARQQIAQIRSLNREIEALACELAELVKAQRPKLLAEHGCGPVTAAIIIGHTAGAQRFRTDACFARHAGTAPIPASSGNTQRHRLHRGGNRQLNRAIHIIALSRARTDPATRAYLNRKHAEGKTKREAIRCLKRHVARRIWRILYTSAPAPHQRPVNPNGTVKGDAPALMQCTR